MKPFTIEGFAAGCKQAMADSGNAAEAAQNYLQQTLDSNDAELVIQVLQDAVPPGADIGEMIVHQSPELTMLFARVPPRFQSGIHNHTVFACIGQLQGAEVSTIFEADQAGDGLTVGRKVRSDEGEVVGLPADVIHCIENPNDSTSMSLHIYGGDFSALMDQRSLWSSDQHQEIDYSFEGLIAESIKSMKQNENEAGLDALVTAIPKVKPLVDNL